MASQPKEFRIKVLGRLLEHLGVQMYKHRDAAIAELVANAWDAGASNIWITIPPETTYNQATSIIEIEDDGCGMDDTELQNKYLVIGRNRRTSEGSEVSNGRAVMGRKGIGKLSGFGIANSMTITTWKPRKSTVLTLNLDQLKADPINDTPSNVEKKLQGNVDDQKPLGAQSDSGTKITLSTLKQKTPIDLNSLHVSLARRFSRTVQGLMKIHINGDILRPIELELHKNSPKLDPDVMIEDKLPDGKVVKYSYAYSNNPITKDRTMQGWTILVNGKTAQAPPFFFNVEVNGRSQHSSKYLIGIIEADFLDEGNSDESDVVATDRQEIDWERDETKLLWKWGRNLTQRIFNEIGERNSDVSMNLVLDEPEYLDRIDRLVGPLQDQCLGFIRSIGAIKVEGDEIPPKEKVLQLADQVIKAFEYRHFVDVIDDIKAASDTPEHLDMLLTHLQKWEVLESRSLLEIIRGRLGVIDKFQQMIINKAPEVASHSLGADNFHDLIAGFPWLLNPEWQIFLEEKKISTILKGWGCKDMPEEMKSKQVDFLGLQGENTLAVVEIKSVHNVLELSELRRLEDYKIALEPMVKNKQMVCVLIFGGIHQIPVATWERYKESPDFLILEWKDIFDKNKQYYEHYRAVLESHLSDPDFSMKAEEVRNSRKMLSTDSVHRTLADRRAGLGVQNSRVEPPTIQ